MTECKLPELPDDLYWEVGENSPSGFRVCIVKPQPDRTVFRTEYVPRTVTLGRSFWRRERTLEVPVTREVHVPVPEDRLEQHYSLFVIYDKSELERIPSDAYLKEEKKDVFGARYFVYDLPCTEENILFLANRVLNNYNKKVVKAEARRKSEEEKAEFLELDNKNRQRLFGSYPPKTFKKEEKEK